MEYNYTETGKLCKLFFDKQGTHIFGGEIPAFTYVGEKPNQLLHLFLTLDLSDKYCPVFSNNICSLPLIYPLKNSGGGGEIQYQVLPENKIKIFQISEYDNIDFVEHNHFPKLNAKLIPVDDYDEDDILLGDSVESCQGKIFAKCANPECSNRRWEALFPIIALFPSSYSLTMEAKVDIWGEYTEEVQFCFCLCNFCGMILGVNRCT